MASEGRGVWVTKLYEELTCSTQETPNEEHIIATNDSIICSTGKLRGVSVSIVLLTCFFCPPTVQ